MKVKIGQKYSHKDEPPTSVKLRVVGIDGQIAEMERCEHQEGLDHETFNLKIDHLLENYDLVPVDTLSQSKSPNYKSKVTINGAECESVDYDKGIATIKR